MNSGATLKRVFDFLAAGMLLILVSPILVLVAASIFLAMGRPIFFKQLRPGYRGTLFPIYKFRTMTSRETAAESDATRLTRVGAFLRRASLDELPELFNVMRGEMSLVGPRPLLPEYLERYTAEQARRHETLPGITGWAQVNGRNAIGWEKRFELDVWYVDHCSFFLDLRILFMTLAKVLKREGINAIGHATMHEFRPISVIGGGGHAKVVIQTLRAAGFSVGAIYDDNASKWGGTLLGVPITGPVDALGKKTRPLAVIAIGNNEVRKSIAARIPAEWQRVVHPSASVDPTARLGEGTVVFAGAVIQADAVVGAHSIVNTAVSIDHDCRVGDHVHLAAGSRLAGEVTIGEGTFLGMGTHVISGLSIGSWSTLCAGSVVVSDPHLIPDDFPKPGSV